MRKLGFVAAALASAAVVAGCGTATVGNGSSPDRAAHRGATIAIAIPGPSRRLSACGSNKPFAIAAVGQPLLVRGRVRPAPKSSWRAKLKLKRCGGTTWQVVDEEHVKLGDDGRFEAILTVQRAGAYTIRAYYYAGGRRVRSAKAYASVGTA